MSSGYDLRRFTRVPTDSAISLACQGDEPLEATIQEISAVGLSVESPHDFALGTEVGCSIPLATGRFIEFTAQVVWRDRDNTGFTITQCDPASSMYLKEFLMEHAHDPCQVESEYQLNILELPPH